MRISYAKFMLAHGADGRIAPRQYIFVDIDVANPGDASPIFPDEPTRRWAIVDDEEAIEKMRVYVPAEDRIWIDGKGIRIDYDASVRPILIVHDMR